MLASELLGRPVRDGDGRTVGRVRDLRLPRSEAGSRPDPRIVAVVVGGRGQLAAMGHAWGFVEGRAAGPGLLRRLFRREFERARLVPARAVTGWGGSAVHIRGRLADYPLVQEMSTR